MADRKSKLGPVFLCLFFVFFITLISRTPTLGRITHLQPLWSYISLLSGKTNYAGQIVLNIALFIPLGYFLSKVLRPLWVILTSLSVSAMVELLQFMSYRGMLDVDDLVSNVFGALIGILLWKIVEKKNNGLEKVQSVLLLTVGAFGCVLAVVSNISDNTSLQLKKQFYFAIESEINGDNVEIKGQCYVYDRPDLAYKILVEGVDIKCSIYGTDFSGAIVLPDHKVEVMVQFRGHPLMPTGVWINKNGRIEYVAENVENPAGVPEGAVLKAYNREFDTYVYEDKGIILWLIGCQRLERNMEVIYHINTNEPEKLPEKRKQYGFDNRGFHVKDKNVTEPGIEFGKIGAYRMFKRDIPTEYNVSAVSVGFNIDGTVKWYDSFRLSSQGIQSHSLVH